MQVFIVFFVIGTSYKLARTGEILYERIENALELGARTDGDYILESFLFRILTIIGDAGQTDHPMPI